jgi:hypothetical protein
MKKKTIIKDIMGNISFIYMAMFLTLITYIVLSSLYISNVGPLLDFDPQLYYIIQVTLILLLIVLAPVSYAIPQRMINRMDITMDLENKLLAYRSAIMIRYIALNIAGLLVALAFLLTGNTNLILVQAIVLLFFIIYKPSPFRIAADLNLNDEEKQQLL